MSLPPPEPKFDLRGVAAEVTSLHFHCGGHTMPNPPLLYSGTSSGLIQVWNLNSRRTVNVLDGHDAKSVYWLQTLNNKFCLMSQGRDLRVHTWSLAEGRNEITDSISMESVGFCKCSLLTNEHNLLAMPGKETSQAQVMDLSSKKIIGNMEPAANSNWGMVMCIKLWQPMSGSSPLLIAGYEDGSVVLWNVLEQKLLSRIMCHKHPVMSLDFDCENSKGVSGSSEKILNVWTLDKHLKLKTRKTQEIINRGIGDIAIREDKKILATAGWDCRVRIFGWKKMKPLAVLQYHSAGVNCVAFSDHNVPEERLLASGSKDQRIGIWSIYSQPS